MNILRDIERQIIKLKNETAAVHADLKFRKLMHAFKGGFDPDQLRDEQGRWTNTDGAESESDENVPQLASYSSSAECNAQYKRDIFQCKMVGLSTCYAQAMVRLVACQQGNPIPPLHY